MPDAVHSTDQCEPVSVRLVESNMFGVRKDPKGCNFVHNDQIWYVLYGFLALSVLVLHCMVSVACAGKSTFAANCKRPGSGPIRGGSSPTTTV